MGEAVAGKIIQENLGKVVVSNKLSSLKPDFANIKISLSLSWAILRIVSKKFFFRKTHHSIATLFQKHTSHTKKNWKKGKKKKKKVYSIH